jgi:low molecular weight protein-tyrosine phosphatase
MVRSDPASSLDSRGRVLFVSNDGYCCGRFCEELFNHLAVERGLGWRSTSRALLPASAASRPYPMSPIAIDFLRRRGASAVNGSRPPVGVTSFDFQASSIIVALDESEHRSCIASVWQQYSDWVRYWQGGMLQAHPWGVVFDLLDGQVLRLIQQLSDDRACFDAA